MIKSFLVSLFFLLYSLGANSQAFYEFTAAASRTRHDNFLKDSVINATLQQPFSQVTEKEWMKAFWAMELLLYKTPQSKEQLKVALQNASDFSETFQKALLEVSFTLYPGSFNKQVGDLLRSTQSPAVFTRCAEYLLVSSHRAKYKMEIDQLLKQKFEGNNFTGLSILQQRLKQKTNKTIPHLQELFSKDFLPGQTIIYSLQRNNRNFPGLVIIRKGDGSFVKDGEGKLFHTAQLARAITNYPFYITNGNTPQGIFKWTGFDTSTISYIGPTTNLQMVMPVEVSPETFFNDSAYKSIQWSKELYGSMLPSSLKNVSTLYESFLAGAMGRSEIIMHGTTINPLYYKDQSYFPQTPSMGCLCSYEEWDHNGKLKWSNQQQIVDALSAINSRSGYVVVIDIDHKDREIKLSDIGFLVQDADRRK